MYCLEAVVDVLPAHDQLKSRVKNFLGEEDFSDDNSNNQLLGYIERILLLIGKLGLEEEYKDAPLGRQRIRETLLIRFHPGRKRENFWKNVQIE